MTDQTSLVGKVCQCSKGRLGVVTGFEKLAWGQSWVGLGLDDGSLWSSRTPAAIRTATKEDVVTVLKLQPGVQRYYQGFKKVEPEDLSVEQLLMTANSLQQLRAESLNKDRGGLDAG